MLSLAAPIWEPHPNTNVGAILVFQASKLDLSLLWSASVCWSHSRTSLTAAYLAGLNIRFEDGEIQRCGKKGRLGWSLFPPHCEAESDPLPRNSESRVSRITEASLPPHFWQVKVFMLRGVQIMLWIIFLHLSIVLLRISHTNNIISAFLTGSRHWALLAPLLSKESTGLNCQLQFLPKCLSGAGHRMVLVSLCRCKKDQKIPSPISN